MIITTALHRDPTRSRPGDLGRRTALWGLRLLGAACLAVSSYTHLHLARGYDVGPPITLGELFIAQGVACGLLALWLLLRDSRLAWLLSTALMAASAAAVLISYRLQIPAIGPLPSIYDPVWFPEKAVSAVSEVAFVALALVRLVLQWRPRRTR